MTQHEPFLSLLLALFAGLLIGLERQQSAENDGSARAEILGGARTHPLVAWWAPAPCCSRGRRGRRSCW